MPTLTLVARRPPAVLHRAPPRAHVGTQGCACGGRPTSAKVMRRLGMTLNHDGDPTAWSAGQWRAHIAEEHYLLFPKLRALHDTNTTAWVDALETEHAGYLATLDGGGTLDPASVAKHSEIEDILMEHHAYALLADAAVGAGALLYAPGLAGTDKLANAGVTAQPTPGSGLGALGWMTVLAGAAGGALLGGWPLALVGLAAGGGVAYTVLTPAAYAPAINYEGVDLNGPFVEAPRQAPYNVHAHTMPDTFVDVSPDGFPWIIPYRPGGTALDSHGTSWRLSNTLPPYYWFNTWDSGGFLADVASAITTYVLPALGVLAAVVIPGVGGVIAGAVLVAASRMAQGAKITDAFVAGAQTALPSLAESSTFRTAYHEAKDTYDAGKDIPAMEAIAAKAKAELLTPAQRTAYDSGQALALAAVKQRRALDFLKYYLPARATIMDEASTRGAALIDLAFVYGGPVAMANVQAILDAPTLTYGFRTAPVVPVPSPSAEAA